MRHPFPQSPLGAPARRAGLILLTVLLASGNNRAQAQKKPAPSPEVLLKRVQKHYRQAGDFQMSFSQIFVEKVRGKKREASGVIWAKADGRVRWEYRSPEAKYFFYDGQSAFFYEPQSTQVTTFENFRDSRLYEALRFVLGQEDYAASFDAQRCTVGCDYGEASDITLRLIPREPLGTVDHVLLSIIPDKHRIRVSVVIDSQGNRTEYRFSAFQSGLTHQDSRFQFIIPEGVQIIDGTAAR